MKVGTGLYIVLTAWDLFSSQLGLPTLRAVLGAGVERLPVWAYVDMAILLLLFAMFELMFDFARNQPSAGSITPAAPVPEKAGAEQIPAIEPDIQLTDVVGQILDLKGKLTRDEVARELADKVTSRRMRVWTRSGNKPLTLMEPHDLRRAAFDLKTAQLVLPGPWEPIRYSDIRFLRSEVDQVWPPVLETKQGIRPPSAPAPA